MGKLDYSKITPEQRLAIDEEWMSLTLKRLNDI